MKNNRWMIGFLVASLIVIGGCTVVEKAESQLPERFRVTSESGITNGYTAISLFDSKTGKEFLVILDNGDAVSTTEIKEDKE